MAKESIMFLSTKMVLLKRRHTLGRNPRKLPPISCSDSPRKSNTDRNNTVKNPGSKDRHKQCLTSNKQPVPKKPLIRWKNSTKRPPFTFEEGLPVNPKRHTSCMITNDPGMYTFDGDKQSWRDVHSTTPRKPSPKYVNMKGLTPGQQAYMSCVARVYQVSHMMDQKLIHFLKKLPNNPGVSPVGEDQKTLGVLVDPKKKNYSEHWSTTNTASPRKNKPRDKQQKGFAKQSLDKSTCSSASDYSSSWSSLSSSSSITSTKYSDSKGITEKSLKQHQNGDDWSSPKLEQGVTSSSFECSGIKDKNKGGTPETELPSTDIDEQAEKESKTEICRETSDNGTNFSGT